MGRPKLKIGIVLDGRASASAMADLARLAEKNGIENLWLSAGARTKDHFVRLAVAASSTTKIRLGPVATSPFEMHPVVIGTALLTLDEAAAGRGCIVVGGGGDLASTLGAPLRNRVQAVEDTLRIIRKLAEGGEVNYEGNMFKVAGLFSPWNLARVPPMFVGANRPRMLELAAKLADGVMFTDMPGNYVAELVHTVKALLSRFGRSKDDFQISNWFVWNVQDNAEEARRLARAALAFRLYYIKDVAGHIGLARSDAVMLERRQPEMVRALLRGRPELLQKALSDLIIDKLTITGDIRGVDRCIERLHEFKKQGLTQIALSLEGDPAKGIRTIGQKVVPIFRET
ncbi:LLM class flavin-dependent oxidoreductase [Candidatus Bathyarchaeota archaeon]|nr:MAG: LLM class flavin-dependent oxidoreductase [Candidatus Bathyarchaeota archaeon]